MEVTKNSHKKNPTSDSSPRQIRSQKLYQILFKIYEFSDLKDLFLLKEKEFATLCGVKEIHWYLNEDIFKNESLLDYNFKKDLTSTPHHCSCSLSYKNQIYGELIFISSKITKAQSNFLQKIGLALSSSLYFMQNKKRLEISRKQWEFTFNSFYRAFCITDNNFRILKFNQAFSHYVENHNLLNSKISDIFPFPIKKPIRDGSWISQEQLEGKKISLEFHLKTLYLKNERFPIRLIRVKDVTERIKMEQKINQQAQKRELGFIKGSVAHELNNPLAGIKTLLHLLLQNLSSRESFVKGTLEEMSQAVERCQAIIQNLLSISHSPQEEKEQNVQAST